MTKIVYFETHPQMTSQHSLSNDNKDATSTTSTAINIDNNSSTPIDENNSKTSHMKRSKSLERLHTPDYQEALQKLYSYMNEPQTFHNKQGLRDDALSFYSEVLGGRIHFLHFETRRMSSTLTLSFYIRRFCLITCSRCHQITQFDFDY